MPPDCENVTPYGTMRGTAAFRQVAEVFRAGVPGNKLTEALEDFAEQVCQAWELP